MVGREEIKEDATESMMGNYQYKAQHSNRVLRISLPDMEWHWYVWTDGNQPQRINSNVMNPLSLKEAKDEAHRWFHAVIAGPSCSEQPAWELESVGKRIRCDHCGNPMLDSSIFSDGGANNHCRDCGWKVTFSSDDLKRFQQEHQS